MTNLPTGRRKFLGSWGLISFEWRNEGGDVRTDLGDDPVGQITYDASGTFSVQMMRRTLSRFSSDDLRQATSEEKACAWSGYFGYFGTYTVSESGDAVTHHVEGSSFPNIVGTDQLRSCTFLGDRLTLTSESQWGRVTIVWQKVQQA